MLDRVPTKPNRYAVYDDAHTFLRYEYHERADEPTQVGDALNKANLLPDAVATALGLTGNPQVKDALSMLSTAVFTMQRTFMVSQMEVGSKYTIDGTEFLCCASDYPIAGTKMLILDSCYLGTGNHVTFSDANTVTTSFFNALSAGLQNMCVSVSIGTQVSSSKCFNLSYKELGGGAGEGDFIPYFSSDNSRKTSPTAIDYWTRTVNAAGSTSWSVSSTGALTSAPQTATYLGVRPAIILDDMGSLYALGSEMCATEVGNVLVDILGNAVSIPQITTGSYTGTGTFGNGNKNILTLPFAPKRISIINSTGIVFGELIIKGATVYGFSYSGSYAALVGSIKGNTISWHATDAAKQLNASGLNYLFVAEG